MRTFRYYVYMTQDDLDEETPTHIGTVTASNRSEATDQVDHMFPGAYYLYCVL